jgi:glycosyltransferase involved in cell wall biosynthesis
MIRVLLLHGGNIPHYRVPVYNYLSNYLKRYRFELMVASPGIQPGNPHAVEFQFHEVPLSVLSIARLIHTQRTRIVILFVDLRHLYLFPTYLIAKLFLGQKMVWWGQGRDLADRDAKIKNLAYATEHAMCDSIILYAEHLKKYVAAPFHKKVFIANNTLVLDYACDAAESRKSILAEYGIRTRKNIICVGRLQKRKRLDQLVAAHAYMNRPDIGLILVGPDQDGVLDQIDGANIYKLGPVYGTRKFALLSACDVYCLPGAVGLSIVDAFHCGLPIVSENGDESAEIMYLKDGVNGFVVPRGDVAAMAEKLLLLIDNDSLWQRFSDEARNEIAKNGHIENLCAGFRDALRHAMPQSERALVASEDQ